MSTATLEVRVPGVTILDEKTMRWHRRGLLFVTIIPFIGLIIAVKSLWGRGLSPVDAWIFVSTYAVTCLGITIGFHRMFTHKALQAPKAVRVFFAVAGSMAIESSVIDWVAAHRRHHAYADKPGDPHSPHLEEAQGLLGIAKGLWHAHVGWLFKPERTSAERWAPDLLREPAIVKVDRLFGWFVFASFAIPPLLGYAFTGTLRGTISAFVWGSLVRIFVLHHVTFSINSICHFYGNRPYETREQSTNNWLLALPSFGEAWHNNHHAFPTSAFLGLRAWQIDIGGYVIRAMKAVGLVRRVKHPSAEQVRGSVAEDRAA